MKVSQCLGDRTSVRLYIWQNASVSLNKTMSWEYDSMEEGKRVYATMSLHINLIVNPSEFKHKFECEFEFKSE